LLKEAWRDLLELNSTAERSSRTALSRLDRHRRSMVRQLRECASGARSSH
jgi:hypothetical protein